MSYADDRWTDNAPECPYCGVRVKSLSSRECANCAKGPAVIPPERIAARPSGESFLYPPIHLTPEQIEAWRKDCQAFDAKQTGEQVPEKVIREAELAASRK